MQTLPELLKVIGKDTQKGLAIHLLSQQIAAGNAVLTAVAVTSPNATDLPTALTLLNELKTQFNKLIADLSA